MVLTTKLSVTPDPHRVFDEQKAIAAFIEAREAGKVRYIDA